MENDPLWAFSRWTPVVLAAATIAYLALAGCGGGGTEESAPITPKAVAEVQWTRQPDTHGGVGHYTPIAITGNNSLRVYSNTIDGGIDGRWYASSGTLQQVGNPAMVLQIADPRDSYIRTSAVVRGESGAWYALLYTGDGYPTQGGYSPSWATSADGTAWDWHGPVSPFGRHQSSAAALTVDEGRTDGYRFRAWLDGTGRKMVEMHSPDGRRWASKGKEEWPENLLDDAPQFMTAARTPYGTHLIAANGFPASRHRHLWQCAGGSVWRVLEDAAPTLGEKGTNLAYDASTGTVHALTGAAHWTFTARAFPC